MEPKEQRSENVVRPSSLCPTADSSRSPPSLSSPRAHLLLWSYFLAGNSRLHLGCPWSRRPPVLAREHTRRFLPVLAATDPGLLFLGLPPDLPVHLSSLSRCPQAPRSASSSAASMINPGVAQVLSSCLCFSRLIVLQLRERPGPPAPLLLICLPHVQMPMQTLPPEPFPDRPDLGVSPPGLSPHSSRDSVS